jgi:hypothetical protein
MAQLATGALSGLGNLAGGFLQSSDAEDVAKMMIKSQEKIHEEGTAEREKLSQMVRADQQIAEQNLLAGEQARLNVLSSLGQPGTYGSGPGSSAGPISLEVLKPTGLSGITASRGGVLTSAGTISKTGAVTPGDVALGKKPRWKGMKEWEVTGTDLDPDAMAGAVQDTAGFRTVSRMVAEAEQLMNRTGPLWNQLNNTIVGGIYETNAAFERQAMEQLARNMARGGTARRVGLQMAQAFQIQEQINRNRTGQLWQAKLGLEEYRTKYAQQVTSYAQAWVNNHAGIRDSFINSLQNLQMFWASTMAPTLVGATVKAQEATSAGVLNASQGLKDAANTKGQAISGAIEGFVGITNQVIADKWPADDLSKVGPYAGGYK